MNGRVGARNERSEDRETARGSRSGGDRGRASRAARLGRRRAACGTRTRTFSPAKQPSTSEATCWNTARRRRSDCSVGRSASMSSFTSVATGPLAPHAGRADAAAACATDRAAVVASPPSFPSVPARGASCPPMSRALASASEADPSAPTAPSTSRDASPVDTSRSSAARRPAPAPATSPSARSRENSTEILKALSRLAGQRSFLVRRPRGAFPPGGALPRASLCRVLSRQALGVSRDATERPPLRH